ncbi:hypothetical protein [Thioalkalivibrio sp. ALMg11]|uniref:hypothetical protein n=1 Tax=Thioalkalivibrio sp. ALMg11 TaxID=1158165 RepID=UPI0018CB96C0|nr:hypothetical protein [Thioalkalivibrio sp. ALMg11]
MDDEEQERDKELEEKERQQRLENMQRRSDGQMGVGGFEVLYEPKQDEGEKKDGE